MSNFQFTFDYLQIAISVWVLELVWARQWLSANLEKTKCDGESLSPLSAIGQAHCEVWSFCCTPIVSFQCISNLSAGVLRVFVVRVLRRTHKPFAAVRSYPHVWPFISTSDLYLPPDSLSLCVWVIILRSHVRLSLLLVWMWLVRKSLCF